MAKTWGVGGCVECHRKITPGIVTDWELSTHATAREQVDCIMCHNSRHKGEDDVGG